MEQYIIKMFLYDKWGYHHTNVTGEYFIYLTKEDIVFSRDNKDAQTFYSRSKANSIKDEAVNLITHSFPDLDLQSAEVVTIKSKHKVGKNILI